MTEFLDPNRVPAAPIVEAVLEHLSRERTSAGGFEPESVYALAAKVDVKGNTLEKILEGRSKTIDFDLADRLLCALNIHELWLTELRSVYESALLAEEDPARRIPRSVSGSRVCARRGCAASFVPPRNRPGKRFCSRTCAAADYWHRNHATKTRIRGKDRSLEQFTCKNGHERSPENTRIVDGVRRCLECKRIADRRSAARRRKKQRDATITRARPAPPQQPAY